MMPKLERFLNTESSSSPSGRRMGAALQTEQMPSYSVNDVLKDQQDVYHHLNP